LTAVDADPITGDAKKSAATAFPTESLDTDTADLPRRDAFTEEPSRSQAENA
jgi:hypothetical protein